MLGNKNFHTFLLLWDITIEKKELCRGKYNFEVFLAFSGVHVFVFNFNSALFFFESYSPAHEFFGPYLPDGGVAHDAVALVVEVAPQLVRRVPVVVPVGPQERKEMVVQVVPQQIRVRYLLEEIRTL